MTVGKTKTPIANTKDKTRPQMELDKARLYKHAKAYIVISARLCNDRLQQMMS
jgi:hypothetical protein